jgi:hypothetical protein
MCTPDGKYIWSGSGWAAKRAAQTCQGTFDPNIKVPAPTAAPSYSCSPDGLEYVYDGAAGVWQPTGRTCTPTATPTTPPASVNTPTNPYSATNLPTSSGGGITVTERPSLRTVLGKRDALVSKLNIDAIAELIALAPTLPACPESSLGTDGDCYSQTPHPSLPSMTLPPGSFEYFGVVFHVSEIQAGGRFEKNFFVPDANQKLLMDAALLEASHRVYASYDDISFSVKAASQNRPDDFRTAVDGFALNPVQPTEEEMTTGGGYARWRARGGYPLSLEILRGAKRVNETGVSFPICASIKCACPQDNAKYDAWRGVGYIAPDQQVVQWPRCIGGVISAKGLQTGIGTDPISWDVFIAIDESNPSQYSMHLVAQKDSWVEKVGEFMAEQLQKLAGVFCAAAPSVKEQLTTSVSEKCVDKQQKSCTKGAPGCTCVKPTTSAQVGVHAFNAWASYWCGAWMQENTAPMHEEPMPQVPPEMQAAPSMPWWQWGLVAAGGVGVGAMLFNRRK